VPRLRFPHVLLAWLAGFLVAFCLLELNARLHPPKWIVPFTFHYVTHGILQQSISHPLFGIAVLFFPCVPVILTIIWALTNAGRHLGEVR
jgi:cobalamin biosynthesis protein CobD/CbiB